MALQIKNLYAVGITVFFSKTNLFALETSDSNSITVEPIGTTLKESTEVLNQLSEYGDLISNSLYFIVFGMFMIYLLHKLTSKYLYPHMKKTRIIKVAFGTLYALIIVVAVLMVLKKLGFDVSVIGKISILSVLVGSVCIFFLLPFLPRLPFKIGHMVEINGILGTVDNISTYHTTIRKFDGTMVFIPNTAVMGGNIMNYHDIPTRRIEMHIEVSSSSDITTVKELLLTIMSTDDRVLKEPAPSLFITDADVTGIKISTYCWVNNGDWLSARSDLWIAVQKEFIDNANISMARRQQEVYVLNKDTQ